MNIFQTKDPEMIARLNKEVHEVHTTIYPEYFKEYNYEIIKDFFEKIIEKPNFVFLVGEVDGQFVGYAWIEIKEYPENAFRRTYRSVYVHQLVVLEKYRKNGYGIGFMDKVNRVAAENHIHKIELDYWSDNRAAESFYIKNGFKSYREFVYKDL